MDAVKKKPAVKNGSRWMWTLLRAPEIERLRQAAEAEGLSMSAILRRALLRDLARGSGPIREDYPEASGR